VPPDPRETFVIVKLVLRAVLLLPVLGSAAAQGPTVEDFFKSPQFSQMQLSPNGEWLAALVPIGGRRNIAVMSIDERRAAPITHQTGADIVRFFWANDNRLVYVVDRDGNEAFGLLAVDRDGSNWRVLAEPPVGVQVFPDQTLPLDRLPRDPEHILVTNNKRRKRYPDVFLLDLRTADMEEIVRNPGNVRSWLTDHDGVVRAGVGDGDDPRDLRTRVVYRETEDDDWKTLTEYDSFDAHGWRPLAFAADNRALYVASNVGRDTTAVYTYDPATRELGRPVFARDDVDSGNIRLSPKDHRLLAVSYEDDKPEVEAIDEHWAALRKAIDEALPDTVNRVVSVSDDERRLLVLASSDRDPGSYYFLDRDADRLEYFASRRPWLEPAQMAEMRPVTLTARDGVRLHGYLTLPPRGGSEPPLIVNPHGGPFGVRDHWGFDPETQFLASRGYAVLQVNYRGSGGYGKHFEDMAWGQWGLQMQDDITDATLWAIRERIADRDRICIYGSSYGGYAALEGVVRNPGLYRCAIDYAGVVDLPGLYHYWSSAAVDSDALQAWFGRTIGDPDEDGERLAEASPLEHIDRITVPVLVVHGKRDPRVPVEQAEQLIRGLRRQGATFEALIQPNEGHGFRKQENRLQLYERIEAFLAESLAPATAAAQEPASD
jgi:dipeptidyl aminopeptidase/acylaminoacyl peptidase